jgi:hypothetical protein
LKLETTAPIKKHEAAWPFGLVLAGGAYALGVANQWAFPATASLLFLALVAFAFFSSRAKPTRPGGAEREVSATREGLWVDGKHVMPRERIVRAFGYVGEKDAYAVHVEGKRLRRSYTVWLDSEEQGRELLDALGLPAQDSTARFRALPPWARHFRWLAITLTASPWMFFQLLRHFPPWTMGVLVGLYSLVLLPALLPQHVEVGHDGIFMKWLGKRRFVPFSKIEGVTATKTGVELGLTNGRVLEIRLSQKDNTAAAEIHVLYTRIRDGIDAQRGLSHVDEEALLARSGRDIETWMREMRALGAGDLGGYRAASIPRERLWAVVENAAADPSAREGAALALSASLDDDDRARLLALSQKTASPRLRVALDGVGKGQEEPHLRVALESAENEVEEPISENNPATRAASSNEDL